MLKKFETRHVLAAINYIGQTERQLRTALDLMRPDPDSFYNLISGGVLKRIISHFGNLRMAASEYDLLGLNSALDTAEHIFTDDIDFARLSIDQTTQVHNELVCVHATAINALTDSSIYFLTRGSADYVIGHMVSFGDAVSAAFPTSVYDIEEASKCRGLERWTACVMHCCRALEPALQALENAVPVEVPKEQWGDRINQIESAIKKMTKATHTKEEVQWFSDAATQFHFMKNAWRNYAQHLKHTYDEERASAIYDAVRTFMRHLATKLHE
jgi:hypothetical protein